MGRYSIFLASRSKRKLEIKSSPTVIYSGGKNPRNRLRLYIFPHNSHLNFFHFNISIIVSTFVIALAGYDGQICFLSPSGKTFIIPPMQASKLLSDSMAERNSVKIFSPTQSSLSTKAIYFPNEFSPPSP